MYRYAEYCPLAATTDVIGDYWTPLIVRELLFGTSHFNQLVRNLPEISRSLLSARLRALERANIVVCRRQDPGKMTSYSLTEAGRELGVVLDAMNAWGSRWGNIIHDPEAEAEDEQRAATDVDPMGAICMLKSRIRVSELPARRILMEVVAVGRRSEARAWILCEHGGASLCFTPPAFPVDFYVRGENLAMYRIWRQQLTMEEAMRCRRIQVEGERDILRQFVAWFDASVHDIPQALSA
jgi:DNA-binding HxlR family transcriptional regulator